jgi:polar amino acid transport system substrate-binding protein
VKLGGSPINDLPTGIATLHKDKDLHEALDAAVKEIMANGEYQAILEKWNFEPLAIR